MTAPPLALIVPAFNEARRLADNLSALLSHLQNYRPGAELIVVDDGSADGTAQVAEEFFAAHPDTPARVLRFAQNRGKGHAVRAGADRAFLRPISRRPFMNCRKSSIRSKRGVTTSSSARALDRRLIGQRQPWQREQSGKIFNLIVRLLTGLPFFDTQCGFKAFRMEAARPIIEQAEVDGFGFKGDAGHT